MVITIVTFRARSRIEWKMGGSTWCSFTPSLKERDCFSLSEKIKISITTSFCLYFMLPPPYNTYTLQCPFSFPPKPIYNPLASFSTVSFVLLSACPLLCPTSQNQYNINSLPQGQPHTHPSASQPSNSETHSNDHTPSSPSPKTPHESHPIQH